MALVAGAVWLVALISVAPALVTTGPLPTVRLGVLEPGWLDAPRRSGWRCCCCPWWRCWPARRPAGWPAGGATPR